MRVPGTLPTPATGPGRRTVPGVTIGLGLLLLVAAVVVALAGVLTKAWPAADRNTFLFGIEVGVVGMIGLRLIRGDVDRRLALRRLHRLQERLLSDTREVTLDRDRLAEELAGVDTDGPARVGVERPVTP